MPFLLNIGLTTNQGERMNARTALLTVEAAFGHAPVLDMATHDSDTERTLVLLVDRPLSIEKDTVARLARALQQDCIAAWGLGWPITDGELLGPNAAAWGAFDPDRFLLLNGHTLTGCQREDLAPSARSRIATQSSLRTVSSSRAVALARIAWPPAAVEADYGRM